jgi:Uma2 family endonuclease
MSIAVSVYDQPIWLPVDALTFAGFQRWAASAEIPAYVKVTWSDDGLLIEGSIIEQGRDFAFRIPSSANTPEGFTEWAISDDFPEFGRIAFLQHEIFIDMSPEEVQKHGFIKKEITRVIDTFVRAERLGICFADGTLLRNNEAGLSTEPDALFVSGESLEAGRVEFRRRRGHDDEYTHLIGTPDWVLETVSRSSGRKDKRVLRELYHRAGIAEYWLIDALGEQVDFQILVHEPEGYAAAPMHDGWSFSPVFGRSFRLLRRQNEWGHWEYTLDVSEPAGS